MIYLDYHATTPVDPRVLETMLPYFTEHFGNAASRTHAWGWTAERAVEAARDQVAALIGAPSGKEIVFTSGATESINLALKGVCEVYGEKGRHLITTAVEHKATLDTCAYLTAHGFEVTVLGVDATGQIRVEELAAALRPETILVSVIHANNEVGTVQRVAEIGEACRSRGVLLHLDAAQSAGKVPVDVEAMRVDLLSLSAHKFYGPKGVGALYVRRKGPRVRLEAQLHGGGHERGMRSGTLNVPGIVGMGAAAAIAQREMLVEAPRLMALRDALHERLKRELEVSLNGHPTERLPGNLNVSFPGIEAQTVLGALKELALSTSSACSSINLEPSHVLRAMGVAPRAATGSIRFGLGRFTTRAEIDRAGELVVAQVRHLHGEQPKHQGDLVR